MTNYRTLVTATDHSLPMKEIVPGHFVHQSRQCQWAGEATDATIRSWLRAHNLDRGSVHVFFHTKGRIATAHERTVFA